MARKLCLAVLVLASLSLPAWGQQCVPLDILDDLMKQEFTEAPVSEMTDVRNNLLRLYASHETGKWHLFLVKDDAACLISLGEKFTRWPANVGRGA